MAVISGFNTSTGARWAGYASDPYITDDFRKYSGLLYPPVGHAIANTMTSYHVSRLPVSAAPAVISGFKQQTYLDDFYYRVHLLPADLQVGNVITDKTVNVTLWNAHFSARTLNAINVADDSGITVEGPAYPYTMQPLRELVLPVHVLRSGPAQISAGLEFVFSTSADSREAAVGGVRVTAWTFQPDWSRPLVERLEWLTDIMTSYDGTEQRASLRQLPRRSFEFQYCADTAKARRMLDNVIHACGAQAWAVPVWTDGSTLSSQFSAGSTILPASTTNTDYHAGGLAIIMASFDNYEVVEVASVGSGTLTLAEATTQTWPAGALVYPARIGLLDDSTRVSRFTGDSAYGVVRFRLTENNTFTAATETTYRGYPILAQAPVWSKDLTTEYKRKLEAIDFGVGGFTHNDESGMPASIQAHHWTMVSRAEVTDFRQFLYARRGKARALWVPTYQPDLQLVAAIVTGSSFINVENSGYSLYIAQAENRRDIRIRLKNGTIFYRRITASIELSASVEQLTLNSAIPANVAIDDIDLISFMALARMDSDMAELSWWTDTVAESTINFRSVRSGV